MEIDPKLQEHLSKFKRLEDFRVDVSASVFSCRLELNIYTVVIMRCYIG